MRDEVDTLHSAPISETSARALYNAIVRIEFNNQRATWFFMKFKIKGKQLFFLFTNYHVITQEIVDSKTIIDIYYGIINNETKKSIKLDTKERFIKCFNKPKDVALIQILESDNIPENKFLSPDRSYQDNDYNYYNGKKFYLAGYPGENIGPLDRYCSSGTIKNIKNFEFNHTLDTRKGSSGSPICLIYNLNVVGIHKSGDKEKYINSGTFIGIILEELEKEDIKINREKEDIKINTETKFIKINSEIDKINKLPEGEGGFPINLTCRINNNKSTIKVKTGNYLYILFRSLSIKDMKAKFVFNGKIYPLYSNLKFQDIGITKDSFIPIIIGSINGK